jgi:hypothetical protein
MPDVAYSLTRKRGLPATVVRVIGTTANPETGERDMNTETYNIRLVVKEHTSYNRLIKAKMAQLDIGQTMFIFWVRDLPFTTLNTEDYIIRDGEKFQVVTSSVEGTSFVVTAKQVVGTIGKQEIAIEASQDIGLGETAQDSVS